VLYYYKWTRGCNVCTTKYISVINLIDMNGFYDLFFMTINYARKESTLLTWSPCRILESKSWYFGSSIRTTFSDLSPDYLKKSMFYELFINHNLSIKL
jgi:hypothetical protein